MLGEMNFDILFHLVTIGIILGLFFGKQFGIFIVSLLLVKLKIVTIPKNANFIHLYVVAVLCGIGFTMSLFIGHLAFAQSPEYVSEVKIGVLTGSLLSAIYGALIIRLANKYATKL
jgi:Na+:H+ antiporter, NhaA family